MLWMLKHWSNNLFQMYALVIMLYPRIFSTTLKRRDIDSDHYLPIYFADNELLVNESSNNGNLTIVKDHSVIEYLISTTYNNLSIYNIPNYQFQMDVQTSSDPMLNQFLAWSNCSVGLFVDYFATQTSK